MQNCRNKRCAILYRFGASENGARVKSQLKSEKWLRVLEGANRTHRRSTTCPSSKRFQKAPLLFQGVREVLKDIKMIKAASRAIDATRLTNS
jgi:hypothetical protein